MDDTEVDPAMMEAMGFTAFGTKPGKKRKLNAAEAFVDHGVSRVEEREVASQPSASQSIVKTAQVDTNIGKPLAVRPGEPSPGNSGKQIAERAHHPPGTEPSLLSFASNIDGDDSESLQALRNGVPNQLGDMVYFLPDFLEDPWQRLRK